MKKKLGLIVVIWLFACFSITVEACTLWAATGDYVQGGGSLIAKNRDWAPDNTQYLKVVVPDNGYRYIGLFAKGNKYSGIKAGVNEFGLTVVTSSASSIPLAARSNMPHYKGGTISAILKNCKTVDEVISHNEFFVGPQNIMIADKAKSAVIEVAPEGIYSIKTTGNGVLYHTNHYIDDNLQWANFRKPGESSLARYERISDLLRNTKYPFNLNDFIVFSEDQTAGLDNSIWRIGSTSKKARTLAAFIVHIPLQGSPVLYVKMANPEEEQAIYNIYINEVFNN